MKECVFQGEEEERGWWNQDVETEVDGQKKSLQRKKGKHVRE